MMTGVSVGTTRRGTGAGFLARIAVGLLALVVIAAIWYRQTYNVWPGQEATARVHWCGRDYEIVGGPPKTWQQISSQERLPVRPVGKYPPLGLSRQELFAATNPQAQRASVSPPPPCPTTVYLRIGSGEYRPYTLEGGP
jgi:hypothetical protein